MNFKRIGLRSWTGFTFSLVYPEIYIQPCMSCMKAFRKSSKAKFEHTPRAQAASICKTDKANKAIKANKDIKANKAIKANEAIKANKAIKALAYKLQRSKVLKEALLLFLFLFFFLLPAWNQVQKMLQKEPKNDPKKYGSHRTKRFDLWPFVTQIGLL